MNQQDFEQLLDVTTETLTETVRASREHHSATEFEKLTFEVLVDEARDQKLRVDPALNPQGFPDIVANGFGVEVKSVQTDSWLTIGNSIFEGTRDTTARNVYVVFGKMGGTPEVRWDHYGDAITHVRTTHMPRFVLDLDTAAPLFQQMGLTYEEFCNLSPGGKMEHVRRYSRGRLGPGERLWWLEDAPEHPHSLSMEVRLYRNLDAGLKVKLRSEAIILSPQIVSSGRAPGKYDDVANYLLTYHGVLCPQVRDLFSAGSVAGVARGGLYIQRSLVAIEDSLRDAAGRLDDALFAEYWGEVVPRDQRLKEWLKKADGFAGRLWRPSEHLFLDQQP